MVRMSILIRSDREERSAIKKSRLRLLRLATTIIRKYQGQNDLRTGDACHNPADLVVGVVLVQIRSLAIIDDSEEQTEGIKDQE